MKIELMIIGAQKSATTSLFSILERHPGMLGPKYKETNFFTYAMDWRAELPRYMKWFPRTPGKVLFEASPSYTLPSRLDMGDPTPYTERINPLREGSFRPTPREAVWEDIHAYNPDMKFIYLVRHPLERIVSGYMHYYLRGYTDRPLEEELRSNRLHLEITRYATRIRPYIDRFGRDQVMVLDFEDMTRQEPALLERIANFIGVDPKGMGKREDQKWGQRWAMAPCPLNGICPPGTGSRFGSWLPSCGTNGLKRMNVFSRKGLYCRKAWRKHCWPNWNPKRQPSKN